MHICTVLPSKHTTHVVTQTMGMVVDMTGFCKKYVNPQFFLIFGMGRLFVKYKISQNFPFLGKGGGFI
eukprot:TRINITY_DN2466_c0_g1_i1.p1 TRINITY_DN2466_c0_g1~~TRINITY_DN2466_c0_g1_i1.p1  ORF type:complete len:68 (+),score=6.23 TRINITY_DN2466_c0_g1_i1:180-383(+)